MSRSKRLRLVCGILSLLCLAFGAGRLAVGLAPLVDPALTTAHVYCQPTRCWTETDPVRLLPHELREPVLKAPDGRARLLAFVRRPEQRMSLAAAEAVRALPSALMFLFLGLAFRSLRSGGGFGRTAIVRLRRAAAAALAAVLAQPIADSIEMTALAPFTLGRSTIFIAFDGSTFFWGMLLAGAVWVAVWALEQARLTEDELAEIV